MSDFNVRFSSRGSQCFFNPILYHKTHLLRMTTDFRVVNSVSFFFFSSAFYAPHSCKQSFFFACDRSFKNISILLYLCKGSRTQIRLIHFFRVFFFSAPKRRIDSRLEMFTKSTNRMERHLSSCLYYIVNFVKNFCFKLILFYIFYSYNKPNEFSISPNLFSILFRVYLLKRFSSMVWKPKLRSEIKLIDINMESYRKP